MRKIELIDALLFAVGVENSDGVQQLIAKAKLCLSDILARCDDSASGSLNVARWVPGWITLFHRCYHGKNT